MMRKIPVWLAAAVALAAVAITATAVSAVTKSTPPRADLTAGAEAAPASAPSTASTAIPATPRPAPFTVSSPITSLDVTAESAVVTITGSQGSATSVVATIQCSPKLPSITHAVIGGTLLIGESWPTTVGVENCTALSITIRVPRGVKTQVNDADGDVAISGLTGPVNATSDSGTLTLSGLTGPVAVSNSDGDIGMTGLTGAVTATCDSGDITMSGISGPVLATNSDGDITGNGLTSRRLNLQDQSGSIAVSLLAPPYSLRASNSDGDVTIGLPGTVSYRVSTPDSQDLAELSVTVPTSTSSPYSVIASSDDGSVSIAAGSVSE
jgi:hypothetical protein